MRYEERDDETLVRAYQHGDRDAFEQLALRHQDRIFRLAAVWLHDSQHAADATQEVLLRSVNGFRTFTFRAQPFTWLYRATRNVCREFNRQRRFVTIDETTLVSAENQARDVERLEAAREVHALVRDLPARQREVVVLRVFEQCSVRETATAMGCREGTVKALLHKATQKLRLKVQQ